MRKVCAKMVPKKLTNEQKANRRDVCLDLLDRLEREPQFKNHFKGRHFATLDNIQKSVTDELKVIPAEAFQHCYEE